MMRSIASKLYQRVTNFGIAAVLALSSLAVLTPLLSQNAVAISGASAVYDGIPSSQPASYTSLGYQATSTKEFGDRLQLGGTNRQLSDVTVSLTDWACQNDFTFDGTNWTPKTTGDPCTTTPGSSYQHDITLNLYNVSGSNTGSLIATKTQSVAVPFRPSADPSCADPTQWKDTTGTCNSGFAFDVTFDFSASNITIPTKIVAAVAFNTESYGVAPEGQSGPYNSLNVSLAQTAPTVGVDPNSDIMFWNTSHAAFYTDGGAGGVGTLRADTGWAPFYLAIRINATKLATPSNLRLNGSEVCGYATNVNFITPTWNTVPGAVSYNYKVTLPNGSEYGPTNVGNVTSVSGAFGGEGLSTFSVQAVDVNGSLSDWATPCAATYDATKPSAPVNGQPATTSVNPFYFTWDSVTDSGSPIVEYQFQSSGSSATSGGSLIGAWQNWVSGSPEQQHLTTPTIHSTGAPDGLYYWQVRAIDAAGNVGPWSSVWNVTVDTVVPDAPVIGAEVNGTALVNGESTNSYTFDQVWNIPAGSPVKYQYKYWNDIAGSAFNSEATPYYNETTGTTLPGEFNQGKGTHYIEVRAFDAAGNPSAWSNKFTIIYNGPIATITSPTNLSTVGNNSTVSILGSTDGSKSYVLSIDGATVKTNVSDFDSFTSYNWNTSSYVGVTTHTVKLVATDPNGVTNEKQISVTVDNAGPALTVNPVTTTGNQPTITGTVAADATSLVVTIDGTPVTATITGTTWTVTVTSPLTDGSHTVVATAKDALGNTTVVTTPLTVTPSTTGDGGTTSGGSNTTSGPSTTTNNGQAVLGATDTNTDNSAANANTDVEGASTTKDVAAADTSTNGNIFGLAWYWWLLILAAIAGIIWWIVGAIRNRNEDNA